MDSGTVDIDLRFPGQRYLFESGQYYNWHRIYDPTTTRYTQPDPLGLRTGPSRYAYVSGKSPSGHRFPGLVGSMSGTGMLIGKVKIFSPNTESGKLQPMIGIYSFGGPCILVTIWTRTPRQIDIDFPPAAQGSLVQNDN